MARRNKTMKAKLRRKTKHGNQKSQEHLFHFLCSLGQGHARAEHPILLDQEALHDIRTAPHQLLGKALGRCLDAFLIRLTPDTGSWGRFDLSGAVWGVAIAASNCLLPLLSPQDRGIETAPSQDQNGSASDLVAEFTHALIDTLPPARTLHEILTYHALLDIPAQTIPDLPPGRSELMQRLIHLSPMTALCHLHLHTPPGLIPLSVEMLPGWKDRATDPAPWADAEDWLNTLIPLTEQPSLARFLRQRWLTLPETGPACRNLGLLLESLRRQGNLRDFILEFYESYDYLCGQNIRTIRSGTYRHWPLLDKIERLLHTGGESDAGMEAAIRLNWLGHEYFLKFHALTQIIRDEGRVPTDYSHLNPGWIPALRPFLQFTEWSASQPEMGPVEFVSK